MWLAFLALTWTLGPLQDNVHAVLEESGEALVRGVDAWFLQVESAGGSAARRFLGIVLGFLLCLPLTAARRSERPATFP